jgi:serine protease Do
LNLTPVRWGDSKSLQGGDWVLTVGQPPGSDPALSAGIFSARRFGAGSAPGGELLETDAAVNAGNSGGPLVNLNGEVVGINTFIPAQRALIGMGFAIPGERARRIASDLIEVGRVRRAYLGMQIEPADRAVAERGLSPGTVAVSSVTPGSPAANSGLRAGDLIVTADGRPLAGIEMLQSTVEFAPLGDELTLGIERESRRQDVKVRPGALPDRAGLGMESPATPATRRDALRNLYNPISPYSEGNYDPLRPYSKRARPRESPRVAPREKAPVQSRPSDLAPAPPPDPVAPPTRPSEKPASDRSDGSANSSTR